MNLNYLISLLIMLTLGTEFTESDINRLYE